MVVDAGPLLEFHAVLKRVALANGVLPEDTADFHALFADVLHV